MPAPERSDRKQTAVLWEASGVDAYGRNTVASPVEILVRWNTTRREITGPQGTPITLSASVNVDQVIPVGSAMWLGEIADWYGTGSGGVDDEVMEVVDYQEVPDLKNRFRQRTVSLAKYRDRLPALS